ncbi:MBL fold metallo-hydrolase [Geobacter sp. AOG2]|uniref:MBL fold metallo-hydrolase n=1 Tax=Geobacter sp. AOG2 TaxID=1566347 RepID=UPI001CC3D1D8|nr:MBL fold metallo-hydrolase [Geobacter sp. AOG2]GFE60297.1 MBL fold metallo-hydrolase [Geobacter sp. AOG2]
MKRLSLAIAFFAVLAVPVLASAANFRFQKVGEGVYAALAEPGSRAASNCLIVVADYQVILAGAHFTKATTRELIDFVRSITPLQVRYVVLTHHHAGFDALDTDFPLNADIIVSERTWQVLRKEPGRIKNQVIFFEKGLTIKRGTREIVMTATERGHSEGDVFVTLPEDGVLFTSDLVFNDVGGYMGDGYFRDWIADLDTLAALDVRTVVPGLGAVTNGDGIKRFRSFFRDFATEALRLAAKGLDVDAAKREFSLPQYRNMPGFKTFFDANFRRAYNELKGLQ